MESFQIRRSNGVKRKILNILSLFGINLFCRNLTRSRPRIIMFHKVYPDGEHDRYADYVSLSVFENVVAYLKRDFDLYTMRELIHFFNENGFFPKRAAVITFDDGFRSFLTLALPVLVKHNIPATVYVCPRLIEQEESIWPEIVFNAYEKGMLDAENNEELMRFIRELKGLSGEKREKALAGMRDSYSPTEADDNRCLMTWKDLQLAEQSGLVEVGSHSMGHNILARESRQTVWNEVFQSKLCIDAKLEQNVESFCFPNGLSSDYSEREIALLSEAGYTSSVTAEFGLADNKVDLFMLPRFGGDFDSLTEARKYIDGLEYFQRKILG